MPWTITSYRQGCGQPLVECYKCTGWAHYDVIATNRFDKKYAALCEKCLANVLTQADAELPKAPEPEPAAVLLQHHCHAAGCIVEVPPRLLMCARHWKMVPKDLQAQIWAHYRPGQEIDKRPTQTYLDIMDQAIAAVAKREAAPRGPRKYHLPRCTNLTNRKRA